VAPGRITATFEVVTPLFLGGADPAGTAELRASSIKGVLRFWWRALAWSRFGRNANALEAIRREEARLFGAAGDEGAGADGSPGQASFILRVVPSELPALVSKGQVLKAGGDVVGPGMRYFGYGLMGAFGENKGKLERPCLPAPFQFSIELVSPPSRNAIPVDRQRGPSVVDALKVVGLLGGLGSRSRRGYGSLSLVSLAGDGTAWKPPATPSDYAAEVRAIIRPDRLMPDEPPYTAFSKMSRVVVVEEGYEPLALLDRIGKQMQRYRSWGHDGRVNDEPSEQNFKDDHDWFKNGASPREKHPRRVVFGLPHNYSKAFGVVSGNYERRGSPFYVHIHKLASENRYIGVVLALRAKFLPAGESLLIRNGSREASCPPQIDWEVLDGFIEGTSKNSGKPYFPKRTPILP
jgi:CRISPR-associated protein Cmr1